MPRTLSQPTEELLENLSQLESETHEEEPGGEKIRVSSVTRGLGFFYERIRNVLDYHEEHLWAKNAIFRILKRRFYEILGGKHVGKPLLEELIRGHYLENNSVPESYIDEVDTIIEKYRQACYTLEETYKGDEDESKAYGLETWLMSLAASEIEEMLHREHHDRHFIAFFYQAMKERLKIDPDVAMRDQDLHLYLASYRNFLLADEAMESYTLFRLYFPEWKSPSLAFVNEVTKELPAIKEKIAAMLKDPIRKDLDRIFKRRSLLVLLLKDIVGQDPIGAGGVLAQPEILEQTLRQLYEERYKVNRARLQRSAFRAVVFIFLTKIILALLAEIPYEVVRSGSVNFWTLGLNTLLPPLILVAVAATIRMPGEEQNLVQLVIDFEKIVAESDGPVILNILRPKKKRPIFTQAILVTLYVAHFAVTLLALTWFFKLLHFNWVSAVLFIFFLSLVSFFALRLRKTANELVAIDEKESTIRAIADFLSFPFIEIGRILSIGLRSINVVALVFDFLIEAPFQAFIEILEEWFLFLRERKQAL